MMWFTSDPHFNHQNVIRFCNRPYSGRKEMDEALIANWNNKIKNNKEYVYVLGDFSFAGTTYTKEIIKRLNGYKILILGNHDRTPKQMLDMGFDEVYENHSIRLGNHNVLLSHFPYHPVQQHFVQNGVVQQVMQENVDSRYLHKRILDDGKTWLLHGHVHQNWKIKDRMINVGVDVWNYEPVPHERLLQIIEGKRND